MKTKDLNKLKVLVVDDYESMRKKVCTILKNLEIEVTEVDNGIKAIEILGEKEFDVVLTDIVMPEMDGFELCDEIKKNKLWQNIPVIVSSTHCDSNYITKALRHGADDYIPKPVDADTVKIVLNRILSSVNPG